MSSIAHDIIKLQFALCTVQTNTIMDSPTFDRSTGVRMSIKFDELAVFLFPCLGFLNKTICSLGLDSISIASQ